MRCDLKEFSESAKRMSSGNEFQSTGPTHEKHRRPCSSRLWQGTHNRAHTVIVITHTKELEVAKKFQSVFGQFNNTVMLVGLYIILPGLFIKRECMFTFYIINMHFRSDSIAPILVPRLNAQGQTKIFVTDIPSYCYLYIQCQKKIIPSRLTR